MRRQDWTRDQLLKTLSLYCQIPFGKMDSRNPAVIELAVAIDRTPSAVALKLVNFASLDPELQGRGIRGMKNTSAADRAIWEKYYGRWDVLAENSIVEDPVWMSLSVRDNMRAALSVSKRATEVTRQSKQRRGQSFFRSAVLAAHKGRCCITGISCEPLLRASHIVPWSRDSSLRLDPRNGLCLNALHDAAFDRGLVTFTENLELRLSKQLTRELPASIYSELFDQHAGRPVSMPKRYRPQPEMLEYHRRHIFVA